MNGNKNIRIEKQYYPNPKFFRFKVRCPENLIGILNNIEEHHIKIIETLIKQKLLGVHVEQEPENVFSVESGYEMQFKTIVTTHMLVAEVIAKQYSIKEIDNAIYYLQQMQKNCSWYEIKAINLALDAIEQEMKK